MPENKLIPFKEFIAIKDTPRYDGFINYFTLGGILSHVREKSHFLRFIEDHSGLEKRLTDAINNSSKRPEEIEPHECDLYTAYKIMHGYGASNEDLLIASE